MFSTDSLSRGVATYVTGSRPAYPILSTHDLDAALGFYRDLLGFALAYRIPVHGQDEYAHLTRGPAALGLAATAGCGPPRPGARDYELCVPVADVDATVTAARAAGVAVLAEPDDMPWGERTAYLADPDGRRIRLTAG